MRVFLFSVLRFKHIGFILLICLLHSCGNDNDSNTNAEEPTDNILALIAKVRKDTVPENRKKVLLEVASKSLKSDTPDSLMIKYYSKLSLAYYEIGEISLFRDYNKRLQKLAEEMGNKLELANSHWDMGSYFSRLAVRDSAFYHYYKGYTLMNEIGEVGDAGTLLFNSAIQQSKARAYVESEQTAFKAIELLEIVDDTLQLFNSYNLLGSVSKELKAYEVALDQFNKAQEYLNKLPEDKRPGHQRSLDNNIGNLYKDQEKWAEAIPYFEAALDFENLESKRPRAYAQTLNNLAYSRFMNGDTANVLEDLNKAYRIFVLEGDNLGISTASYNLATYYGIMGNKKDAIFYVTNAIDKAELSSNYKRKLESLKLLGWIDPQNDLYFDEYVMLSDRLQDEERLIRDKFARIEKQTDEALAEAESLEKERQLILGIAIGLILLGVSSLIIIFQRIRVQRLRFQQQQQEANQEIFNLMLTQKQKMEEGKQSEQKRISEELHDGVLGAMNGIRMVLLGLNGKSDESAVNMRQEAIEKLKEVQEEIRSISHELSDAAYEKFSNFITSIQDLIKETEDSSGLSIALSYDEDVEWDAINGEIKINLYRIVQESIQNVVKHAEASKVELDFQSWDNMLKISISDDGRGFDTRKMKKGIGHRNIKSRVEKINGTWNIESTIGKGSQITVILPYDTEVAKTGMLVNEAGELQEIKKD